MTQIGLHWIPINTPAEKLMDLYYPKFVKEFLKKGRPDFGALTHKNKFYFLLLVYSLAWSRFYWPKLLCFGLQSCTKWDSDSMALFC